jgi:oligopeptide/dipeptide ABC transporter ATP-binding protein
MDRANADADMALLEIHGLTVAYPGARSGLIRRRGPVRVLESFELKILRGEVLGIVGESGSGKSTLLNAILGLQAATSGTIEFDGVDLLNVRGSALRRRQREIQAVFQNPFSSLDPRMTVISLIAEPLRLHLRLDKRAELERVQSLMRDVGLPTGLLQRYPHQLSGGQAQRVAIARALALNPKLVLLDEPTSALDVSVQAQIVNLLMDLQRTHGLTYVFVSHDLALVDHISERVAVMYLGELVEFGPAAAVSGAPLHPYTQALTTASRISVALSSKDRVVARADIPSFASPPSGCRFHTRCPFAMEICRQQNPGPTLMDDGHWARCHLLTESRALPLSKANR